MGKVVVVLLVIFGMLTWLTLWIWLFLFGLSAGDKAIKPIAAFLQRQWLSLDQWLKRPSRAAAALQWTVIIVAIAAICFAYTIDANSWLDAYRSEIAGIAFTVLVIEEVGRLRYKWAYKEVERACVSLV